MNREEYLRQLKKYLKRLPKKDYENAMEYFIEYFDDAGEEGEQRVIEELGIPKEAAGDLLANLLAEKAGETQKKSRKNSTGNLILISFLAILAAPIGLPLACVAVLAVFSVLMLCMCGIVCVYCCSLSCILIGAKLLIRGIVAIPFSLPGALMIGGAGIFGIGCGILMGILGGYLIRKFKAWIPRLIEGTIGKRGRKAAKKYSEILNRDSGKYAEGDQR